MDVSAIVSKKELYRYKTLDRDFKNIVDTDPILKSRFQLRAHQQFVRDFMNPNTTNKRLHLQQMTGMGKCHGLNTPIMMYDGSVRMVQDIAVGDLLMGDDWTPREVTSLARGRDLMARVEPQGEESFTCNIDHILSLCHDNSVIDITLRDFLKNQQTYRHYKLYKTAKYTDESHLDALLLDPTTSYMSIHNECRRLGYTFHDDTINVTRTFFFRIIVLQEDDYYGFTITGNRRYLLGSGIVTHNTLSSIAIAIEFINVYKTMYREAHKKERSLRTLTEMTPTVYVLAFAGARKSFINELLSRPSLGFISEDELAELKDKKLKREQGDIASDEDYKKYHRHLKRRLQSKQLGGFFKFYGYEEFVNQLFYGKVTLLDLEREATARLMADPNAEFDIVAEYVAAGKIVVNTRLLNNMRDSLIIADEIHDTYNSNTKNNRGLAIQYVLDNVPSVRFLSLSATPINNSPTEIIDLLNYLVGTKLHKRDFFTNMRDITSEKLNEIGKLSSGLFSFIRDRNIAYYPTRVMQGKPVRLPHPVGTMHGELPYLTFIECPMSELHQKTYMDYITTNDIAQTTNQPNQPNKTDRPNQTALSDQQTIIETEFDTEQTLLDAAITSHTVNEAETGSVDEKIDDKITDSIDRDATNDTIDDIDVDNEFTSGTNDVLRAIGVAGYTIMDMVFPGSPPVFLSSDKRRADVTLTRRRDGTTLMTGDYLKRENIGTYSQKYLRLLEQLDTIIESSGGDPDKSGKCIIYHNMVEMSGVLTIQELLLQNGYIDTTREPVDSTKCMVCGRTRANHVADNSSGSIRKCTFYPARFATIYGAMDKTVMERYLSKYDDDNNINGHRLMILLGSKIIRQSLDFKCVQHLIITSLPTNISTLIQVFGRCIRTKSHVALRPEQQVVNIYILLSTINKQYPHSDEISPELYRYASKLQDYLIIQKIEQKINEYAIDADIHRDIIWPNGHEDPDIGTLYYEPVHVLNYKNDISTFLAHGHFEGEIQQIMVIVKHLFRIQPVWKYDDLWTRVKDPGVHLESNPALFDESSFVIAMTNLTRDHQHIIKNCAKCMPSDEEPEFVRDGMMWRIRICGEYFIAFPVEKLARVFAEYDGRRATAKYELQDIPYTSMDAETYLRPIARVRKFHPMLKYVPTYSLRYENDLQKFMNRGEYKDIITHMSVEFQRHFLENYIVWRHDQAVAMAKGQAPPDEESVYASEILTRAFKYMSLFGMIVFFKDVQKWEPVAARMTTAEYLKDSVSLPIGFETALSARIYDGISWLDINKNDLGLNIQYRENDIIVGILEPIDSKIVFKVRNPVHHIQEKYDDLKNTRRSIHENLRKRSASIRLSSGDYRTIERGMTCSTKHKDEVLRIAAALGISVSSLPKDALRTGFLCNKIMQTLIDNELGERSRRSVRKYIYGWWSPEQRLQQIIG